jgi:thiamine-monophosphate kinase
MQSGKVGAMMDISDGIASDLRHIMEASGVGAVVSLDRLPLSEELKAVCNIYGWDIFELATSGGEDFELLFTGPEGLEEITTFPLYPIGRITEGEDLIWTIDNQPVESDFTGYRHF